MFCWYAAGSVFIVWNVFQSAGLDIRAVALGGLAPLIVDLPFGEQRYGHTLLAPVVVLAIVMAVTAGHGHRLLRRHLIGLPIGWFCGLALSGAFTHDQTFWWPFRGTTFEGAPLLPAWPVAIALEVLGLLALRWCWTRFRLDVPARRRALWRRGRVMVG
jgi:hypothetical protein